MTFGELTHDLVNQFDLGQPARLRMSVQLAQQIADSPDGTCEVEVTKVEPVSGAPHLMLLTLSARPSHDGV